jgi:hypothetical protein
MFSIPFTSQSVKDEFCDKPLVMYRNELTDPKYRRIEDITLLQDNDVKGDTIKGWEVAGGILFLVDSNGKAVYRIDSLEVTNNVVHAMGEALREAHSQYSKIVLSVKAAPIFHICISSHIDYFEITVPRLLKSLKRVGNLGDTREVLVVVSNPAKRPEPLPTLDGDYPNVTFKQVGYDKYGFTALMEAHDQVPYWLVLHDTCEAVAAFPEGVADIDVGLNPDFVLLADTVDMGFYSRLFIDRVKQVSGSDRSDKIRRVLKDSANIWVDGPLIQRLPEKDVYGGGVKREVHLLDVGIKKYVQSKLDGARP